MQITIDDKDTCRIPECYNIPLFVVENETDKSYSLSCVDHAFQRFFPSNAIIKVHHGKTFRVINVPHTDTN